MSNFPDDRNPYASASEPGDGAPRTSGKAIASLVLGITSIALCCTVFTGVPAIIFGALGLGDIRRSQGKLTGHGMAVAGIVTGSIGSVVVALYLAILPALLLPAVQTARQAARRNSDANNLKQVGLGVYDYAVAHKKLPAAASHNEAGEALLSWREAILPYVEEDALHKEFNKDEPWNGPTNQPLVVREPKVYISSNDSDRTPGETNVLGIVGPDTVLTPDGGIDLRDVTDGTSKTIIAVELAGSGIAWSEPRDITIDEFIAAVQRLPNGAGLRSSYPKGVLCLFADGAVRFLSDSTPPETLRALCTRAGGEDVSIPDVY